MLEDNRAQNVALAIARRQAASDGRRARPLPPHPRARGPPEPGRSSSCPPTSSWPSVQAAGLGLTTPEFAVLLAYTKNTNMVEVLGLRPARRPVRPAELVRYFPSPLRRALRRPPCPATGCGARSSPPCSSNDMVNRAGTSFDFRMTEETGASVADITRAHIVARDVFGPAATGGTRSTGSASPSTPTCSSGSSSTCAAWWSGPCSGCCATGARRSTWPPPSPPSRPGSPSWRPASPAWLVGGPMGAPLAGVGRGAPSAGVPAELAERASAWPVPPHRLRHRRGGPGPWPHAARRRRRLLGPVRPGSTWPGCGSGSACCRGRDRWQSHARAGAARRPAGDHAGPRRRRAARRRRLHPAGRELVDRWLAVNERAVRRVLDVFGEIRTGDVFDLTTLSVALRQLRNVVLTRPLPTGPDHRHHPARGAGRWRQAAPSRVERQRR